MQRLQQCRTEIQANMASKGINASGRTSRAFDVRKVAGGYELVLRHDIQVAVPKKPRGFGSVFAGTAPLDTLEVGRPGGKVPSGFYYLIKQWTRDKGLTFGSESDRQRFSYFTAQKIARQGTKRHTQNVQVYKIPANRAKADILADIRAAVYGAVVTAAQSKFNF